MSANKPNISQIRKYLNGELDARAMHELERQALDDPFLADALEGYERKGNQQRHLADLQKRLQHRITPARKRLTLWPGLTIAASVLLFVAAGGWWLVNSRSSVMQKEGIAPDKTLVNAKPVMPAVKAPVIKPDSAVLKPAAPGKGLLADNAKDATQNNPVSRYAPPRASMADAPQVENTPYQSQATNEIFTSPKLAQQIPSKLSSSGMSGDSPNIQIRGAKSVNGNEPLYVVDGKIYHGKLDQIDPKDIESISTLKDTSSAAIYGSKGANGVILVTTKKGSLARQKSDSLAGTHMLAELVPPGRYSDLNKATTGSADNVKPVEINRTLQGRVAGVVVSTSKKSKASNTLRTITGQVVDKKDGSPLPGVRITVANKNKGVQTNADGRFEIEASNQDELKLAYLGYNSKVVKVKGNDSLNISLNPDTGTLSEIVVVGYGSSQNETETDNARPQLGWSYFSNYIKDKAKPVNGKTGVVRLSFVVNADRSLTDFKVLKSLSPEADKAAIQLVADGPAWLPNTNGKPETVRLRIKFSN